MRQDAVTGTLTREPLSVYDIANQAKEEQRRKDVLAKIDEAQAVTRGAPQG